MNVVIIGAGRRGIRLARHLIEEEKSVTFLDNRPERCAMVATKLDCMAVCGSATDLEKLEEAGCASADIVVAVTDSDEVNIVSCGLVSATYPEVKTIATIRGLTYISEQEGHKVPLLGIDYILNPEQVASSRIADILISGIFRDLTVFPGAHFLMVTTTVNENDPYRGRTLIDMKKERPGRYLIAGVNHQGNAFTPFGDTRLEEGDEIAIILDDREKPEVWRYFGIRGKEGQKLRRIILLGATRICRFLLMKLPPRMLSHITLVEKDEEKCRQFSELFPSILVLNGAITDENFWETEDIAASDLFVSMSENDELNVLISSYARKQGCSKSICLIRTNNDYIKLAAAIDVDAVVSTTEVTVDAIMKILRGRNVKTLHTIFDGDLEVYEYVIKSNFKYLNKALKDIDLKHCGVIAGVSRGSENFLADGNYVFKEGDTVLIVALHEHYDLVQELFASEAEE